GSAAGRHAPAARAAAQDEDRPAVRRVWLRPEQLAAALDRVQRGALRQLPRADFEDLVRRATAAGAALRDPPRLAEARYRASLSDQSLVGSAEWKVHNPGPGPGLLTGEPWQWALRRAHWSAGPPALIGDLDSRPQSPGLELLVDRPGDRTLALEWSARGVAEPGGLRFDLRVPACPVAVLELELPADREPASPRE